MLENPIADSSVTGTTVKRYAPPNQRNRSLGRRKSGERLERANSLASDGEKNPGSSRNVPVGEQGDAGGSYRLTENSRPRNISLQGCSTSEASHLLNERWASAMTAHNSLPEDSVDRPILYTRKAASWGQAMLPHLLMQQSNLGATGGLKDFSAELRQAMRNANAYADA